MLNRFFILLLSCLILSSCQDKSGEPARAAARPAAEPARVALVAGKRGVGHRDFVNAKKVLPEVFRGLEEDFYCGCRYSGKTMDLASCGYAPRKNAERASRLEWEHVVPAWVLGHQRQCWQNGGRKACTDSDPLFAAMEGDLVNLVPSIGEVNGDRGNFPYSQWTREPVRQYGQCSTVVDFKARRVQPREAVRGRAARITLYMHQRWSLSMSRQDRQLMCAWARQFPVDDWERERDRRIVALQGEGNPLVSDPSALARVCQGG
ncbi:endonuclease [Paludibacterium paludis]|uniref:Endonuclease n=1 Tax=Paludibacterium paludis TaxID=1225769 RepID=A0A918P5U9_9NEIS|nr:endonuclease [Paludibacterium paludis]GGY23239.1 endonuclease [Paludibacterium paludis]